MAGQNLAIDLDKASYFFDVTVHGNTVSSNNFAAFSLMLDLPAADRENAFLCRGQAIAKILDGDGTISRVSPKIEAVSVNGVPTVRIKFEVIPINPEPIEFEYAVMGGEGTKASDFARVALKPLTMAPNVIISEEITVPLSASATKASILVTPKSNNISRDKPVIVSVDVKK